MSNYALQQVKERSATFMWDIFCMSSAFEIVIDPEKTDLNKVAYLLATMTRKDQVGKYIEQLNVTRDLSMQHLFSFNLTFK